MKTRAHTLRRIGAAIAGTAVVATTATGCQFGPDEPKPAPAVAVIVVGATLANAQPLSSTDPYLLDLARAAVSRRATVTVVVADGSPRVTATFPTTDRADNDLLRERQDRRYVAAVVGAILQAQPLVPEADYLSALALGCGAAARAGATASLDVIGSGLSTATVRMQDGLLSTRITPRSVIKQLRARGTLPDLHGCPDIEWAGLGRTAAPQPNVTIPAGRRLEEIVAGMIGAAGSHVTFVRTPLTAGTATVVGRPTVSVVPIDPVPPIPLPETLTDEQLGFRPDSAEFRDPGAARVVLGRLAEAIRSGNVDYLQVIGTTSSAGDEAGSRTLSRQRAAAVCTVLTDEFGIPGAVLHPEGVGTHFKDFVADRRADGSLDEEKARSNRLVLLRTDRSRP